MNNEILTRRRLVRYLTPVLVLSVLYNINRFFEAELVWREDCDENEELIMGALFSHFLSNAQVFSKE